jgi:hypothetical protein
MSSLARLYCALLFLSAASAPASAWEVETHVGLAHRAALHSGLDAWLRARGIESGLYEVLALQPEAHRDAGSDPLHVLLADRGLLDELARVDAALGVSPDGARQPALAWMLAGAALEGARPERARNHFARPVPGGVRADRWVEALDNALSRGRMLDVLDRAASGETPAVRQAALARALVCAGAIVHVLSAVGDPAYARGDARVNFHDAGAPLERVAQRRYGRSVPLPIAEEQVGPAPAQLPRFFTTPDGTGLGDLVARSFVSPGTMDGSWGAPRLAPGPEPSGVVPGPLVHTLVAYRRESGGVRYTLTPAALTEAVDALLPRIARRGAQLLDFLFRGTIGVTRNDKEIRFAVGALAIGPGHVTVLNEDAHGKRTPHFNADTAGGPPGTFLHSFRGVGQPVLVYRGVDRNGEPIVLTATAPKATAAD